MWLASFLLPNCVNHDFNRWRWFMDPLTTLMALNQRTKGSFLNLRCFCVLHQKDWRRRMYFPLSPLTKVIDQNFIFTSSSNERSTELIPSRSWFKIVRWSKFYCVTKLCHRPNLNLLLNAVSSSEVSNFMGIQLNEFAPLDCNYMTLVTPK